MNNKLGFSQKHPFLFGISLILAAVIVITASMAAFSFFFVDKSEFSINGAEAGIVKIEGTIDSSGKLVRWIEKLSGESGIKGIIARIDSPGGIVAPSQEIYRALQRASQDKPVVVSMSSVAASGAYYVSCGADKIVANPGTITGSIGVKAEIANIKKLMKKIGVRKETIVSGELKDAGSMTKSLTAEEKKYFQNLVNDLFVQFKQVVVQNRDLSKEQVGKFVDGRAFTGRRAKEYGLVDVLGGMYTAKQELKKMCDLKGEIDFTRGPKREKSILEWLVGPLRGQISNIGKQINNKWYFKY